MPSVDEASNVVGGNADQARDLSGAIVASKSAIDELAGVLGAMGLENKASATTAIGGDAEALAGQANALADALDQLRGRIESLRALISGLGGGGAASVSGPLLSAHSTGPHHKSYDPVKAEPVQPFKDRHKTVGALYVFGERVGDLLWSGEKGPAINIDGVRAEFAKLATVRTHTEGHAAATMRVRETFSAELYINNRVCDRDPNGCMQTIPAVLPAGTVLKVFDINNPQSRPVIFKGTGEGLKDAY